MRNDRALNNPHMEHCRQEMLLAGTGQVIMGLKDFGQQTQGWMQDLLKLLRKAGVQITHQPFGGQRVPRLTNQPPTGRKG